MARRSLVAITAEVGVSAKLPFLAGNPLGEDPTFVVVAEPASDQRFRALAEAIGAEPVVAEARLAWWRVMMARAATRFTSS